jgi:hypothetical protein
MLAWEELQLPPGFVATSPDAFGIGQGAWAFTIQLGDGSLLQPTIEKSFTFSDEDQPKVYGYTVLLPSESDREVFEQLPSIMPDFVESGISGLGGTTLLEVTDLPALGDIGDAAAGALAEYTQQGVAWRMYQMAFRLGDVGALVVVRHRAEDAPAVPIARLARVYSHSIQYPGNRCSLLSVTPVEGATWPSYDFVAEGFYPGESRITLLEGGALLGDEPLRVIQADGISDEPAALRVAERILEDRPDMIFGNTIRDVADDEGNVVGSIFLGTIEGEEDVTLSNEFTFTVFGLYSGCEITQVLSGPVAELTPGADG